MTKAEREAIWRHDEMMRNTHPRELIARRETSRRKLKKRVYCPCGAVLTKAMLEAGSLLCRLCRSKMRASRKLQRLEEKAPRVEVVQLRRAGLRYERRYRAVWAAKKRNPVFTNVTLASMFNLTVDQTITALRQGAKLDGINIQLYPAGVVPPVPFVSPSVLAPRHG